MENIDINFVSNVDMEILGNERLLEQAVTNLIMNAVKYSQSQKIDINLEKSEEKVIIKVTDYGIGISEEHLSRIFERFYRVDKARSRATGGTGLGLAIVKNIAILHGGSVGVESVPNKFTTFTINLPL